MSLEPIQGSMLTCWVASQGTLTHTMGNLGTCIPCMSCIYPMYVFKLWAETGMTMARKCKRHPHTHYGQFSPYTVHYIPCMSSNYEQKLTWTWQENTNTTHTHRAGSRNWTPDAGHLRLLKYPLCHYALFSTTPQHCCYPYLYVFLNNNRTYILSLTMLLLCMSRLYHSFSLLCLYWSLKYNNIPSLPDIVLYDF